MANKKKLDELLATPEHLPYVLKAVQLMYTDNGGRPPDSFRLPQRDTNGEVIDWPRVNAYFITLDVADPNYTNPQLTKLNSFVAASDDDLDELLAENPVESAPANDALNELFMLIADPAFIAKE